MYPPEPSPITAYYRGPGGVAGGAGLWSAVGWGPPRSRRQTDEGQPVRAGAVPVYARRLRESAQLRGDGALPGRRAGQDDRIPLLRLRRADERRPGRLRRDLRDRAQPVLVRHLAQPDPAGLRRRLRRAGRTARRGDPRARPLARQDPRAAEDRRGVRAAGLRQRRPAHRRLPRRAQLRREPERVPARGRDPRALPRAPRADPEGVVRAAALPVERPLREVRPGEHLAAAGPEAASADLDPGHRLARDAAGHPLPGLRLRVPELGRAEAHRTAGLRPLLGPCRRTGPRPQPVPAGLPPGGRRLRDRRAGRAGVRQAPRGALPFGPGRDPAHGHGGAGLRRARRHRGHAAQHRPGRDALPDEDGDVRRDRGQPGRDRGQPGHGRRPDRGVRTGVQDRQPAGDAAERLDAARPDREEHLAVRRGGAAAASAGLGRRGLGKPLVAARRRRRYRDSDRGCSVMAAGPDAVRDETVEVWDSRLRLHVKIAGDGPPLLFFHSLAGLTWQPLLDRLARRHTVYAPEHPGTSPGDPQAIREVQTYWELLLIYTELAGQLGLERPVAIGHSFGGMVAADLAACFPGLF